MRCEAGQEEEAQRGTMAGAAAGDQAQRGGDLKLNSAVDGAFLSQVRNLRRCRVWCGCGGKPSVDSGGGGLAAARSPVMRRSQLRVTSRFPGFRSRWMMLWS